MNISRPTLPALVGVLFSVSLLVSGLIGVARADAAGPATVTFRAVGGPPQYETVVPLTQVTTTTEPVTKGEGSCSGTSAAGALQLGTAGNWSGEWSSKYNDYEVMSIAGKEFPFEESSPQNYYWSFWLDDKESSVGVCEAELSAGDQVLFFPECYGASCPAAPNVLAIEAPATAEVGRSTMVTVLSYPNAGGEPKPAVGAAVTGGGAAPALPTNAQGQTSLTLTSHGNDTLRAVGIAEEASVPAEAFVCVHNGNDGTCGTPAAGSPSAAAPGSAGSNAGAYTGPYAPVAKAKDLTEGHVYKKRHAPRVLRGTVASRTALRDVKLRLTRRRGRKCSYYNGATERFRAMRCGASHGVYFSVGSQASFSYLLPAALAPGRYVFDIEATDSAGEHTTLARGTSRIVFYVGRHGAAVHGRHSVVR